MKLLSWNVRGLNNSRTFRDLKDLLQGKKPDVVFLMETRMTTDSMDRLNKKLGMAGIFSVPRNNLEVEDATGGGGLCLLWRDGINVSFLSSSEGHIDVLVTWEDGKVGRVTRFYGNPVSSQRSQSWELLRRLKVLRNDPWLVCGDFNEILDDIEKVGMRLRNARHIDDFRSTIEWCDLLEFTFTGYKYTWDNRRVGDANIKERLDRGFGNLALIQQWGGCCTHHLISSTSDHHPIIIENDLLASHGQLLDRRKQRFYFEEMWVSEADCRHIVENTWVHSYPNNVSGKLKLCSEHLATWHREKFGAIRRKIADLREKIDVLQRRWPTASLLAERKCAERELEGWLYRNEIYWSQRSRVQWLKHGDQNSKFFHQFASHRRRVNGLRGILDDEN